jgi:hypothetical protein
MMTSKFSVPSFGNPDGISVEEFSPRRARISFNRCYALASGSKLPGLQPQRREDSQAAGVRHCRNELRSRNATHAGLDNRMTDA